MDLFGRKRIKKLEEKNNIYKDLRKKDKLEKEELEKKLKRSISAELKNGSSVAGKEMNNFKKR